MVHSGESFRPATIRLPLLSLTVHLSLWASPFGSTWASVPGHACLSLNGLQSEMDSLQLRIEPNLLKIKGISERYQPSNTPRDIERERSTIRTETVLLANRHSALLKEYSRSSDECDASSMLVAAISLRKDSSSEIHRSMLDYRSRQRYYSDASTFNRKVYAVLDSDFTAYEEAVKSARMSRRWRFAALSELIALSAITGFLLFGRIRNAKVQPTTAGTPAAMTPPREHPR